MSIKIVTEPKVHVIGRQAIDPEALEDFLESVGAPDWGTDAPSPSEALVEVGGRTCYRSFSKPRPGGNHAYIGHILESGHGSVTEHAVFSFIFTGVSRSLTHELIRHRAGVSVSELSQRFVDSSDVAFVLPPALMPHKAAYDADPDSVSDDIISYMMWEKSCEDSLIAYQHIADNLEARDFLAGREGDKTLRRKRAREAARSVLPNCAETHIFVTANARALRNLAEQRASLSADAEIRRLTLALLRVLKREAINLFADFAIMTAQDGTEYAVCDFHKV